jgi:ubiquinone/menaquinone biosynthesis C-methylase UbiE
MSTFDPEQYKTATRRQWEEAAEAWHRWGPLLESWLGPATGQMLDRAEITAGSEVLDVAAGAGGQTLAAARRVGPTGRVVATDISPTILGYAAKVAAAEGLTNVETAEIDGEALTALGAGSFDAVISRVGLIYFPDQHRALAGMRHVLRPGGRVAAIVYSTAEHNAFFSVPVGIIRRRAQLPPPLPGQPGPFSLGAPGVLERALTDAGFRDVTVETVDAPVCLPTAADCVGFERESFGALHQMLAGVPQAERADVWAEVHHELRRFETADGFVGPCELLVAAAAR